MLSQGASACLVTVMKSLTPKMLWTPSISNKAAMSGCSFAASALDAEKEFGPTCWFTLNLNALGFGVSDTSTSTGARVGTGVVVGLLPTAFLFGGGGAKGVGEISSRFCWGSSRNRRMTRRGKRRIRLNMGGSGVCSPSVLPSAAQEDKYRAGFCAHRVLFVARDQEVGEPI